LRPNKRTEKYSQYPDKSGPVQDADVETGQIEDRVCVTREEGECPNKS
jgi:hypothetical protein